MTGPAPAPGIVVVDKPAGMTSHDVVARCRRIFGTRKVGHAGTLDPMATGVLVVGIERATKILGLLTTTEKSYAATIRLGQTTSTEDADGDVLQTIPTDHVTDADVEAAVAGLCGDVDQTPSAVSAIKVGGQRAYKLAREGRPVELAPRRVRISRFDVRAVVRSDGFVDVDVEVDCSAGTYVRALARDVGITLGVGGHLTALRRTAVGRYGLADAHTLERLNDRPQVGYSLDEACLLGFPRRDLTSDESDSAANGRALAPAGIEGIYAATAADGRVIALLSDDGARTKSVVVIRPSTL